MVSTESEPSWNNIHDGLPNGLDYVLANQSYALPQRGG